MSTTISKTEVGVAGVKPCGPELPRVIIPGGAVTITESARGLYGHIAPTQKLFMKGDKVTHLATDDNGKVFFNALTPSAACSFFEGFVQFVKPGKTSSGGTTEPVSTTISNDLADKYLQCEQRMSLPVVRGVLNCPVITERAAAIHVIESGFDHITGMYVHGQGSLPVVTLDEAVELLP